MVVPANWRTFPATGAEAHLRFLGERRVAGGRAWSAGRCWRTAMVEEMLLYDACQGERHACMLPGTVRGEGQVAVKVTILNLSSNGCRLDCLQPLPGSGRVWVRLADLAPWEAQIVWSHGGSAGCRFADPLHPAVVQRLLGARLPI